MDELQSVDLRDKRLERRMLTLLQTLSDASTASIPAACNDRAEMVAAYRFFDNEKVDFESVLAPHIEASMNRLRNQKVALLVQDTTELDLTRPASEMEGVGLLQNGRRCGELLHVLHAFSPDGTPLGTISAEAWTRERERTEPHIKRGTSAKRVACARKPFDEKETYRWLQTSEDCVDVKSHCPDTQLVMLADRESDISEVIDYCSGQSEFDWVIRSGTDRVLAKENKLDESIRVRETLKQSKPRFSKKLPVRSRSAWGSETIKHRPGKADRPARQVETTAFAGSVLLNDPRPGRTDGIQVNAVLVVELNAPKGVEPIEWLLLTSLPVRTQKDIEQVIAYYEQRWMIELYFKVLKSGCKIESRRFEHIDRFEPALALYMIIAWRSLYVCRVSRTHATSNCETLYSPAEWKSVWQIVTRKPIPSSPPALLEFTKLVAKLGGYIDRKNSGPPGPQSMWLGLQRMHDIANCWLTFGPGAKTCV